MGLVSSAGPWSGADKHVLFKFRVDLSLTRRLSRSQINIILSGSA